MKCDTAAMASGSVISCDVCIVGSGAAGITVARELDEAGFVTILIEAGGSKYKAEQQIALQGEVAESSFHPTPDLYRRRMLGGATSIWGGRCVPMSRIDLQARDYVPHSGWPISWEELNHYYPAAQSYCEAGNYDYKVPTSIGRDALPTITGYADPEIETNKIERFSLPTDFGKVYAQHLARSPNVRLALNTRATRLNASGSIIESLDAATGNGRRIKIVARHYVLATGGLETPRLLMLSDPTRRGGLGNENGLLGRFYMCHIENTIGLLKLRAQAVAVVDFERSSDGVYVRRKLCLSCEALNRHKLLNTVARFHYPLPSEPSHGNGLLSCVYLVKGAIIPEYGRKFSTLELANFGRQSRGAKFWFSHLRNIARDAPAVTKFGLHWVRHRILARRKLPFFVFHSRDSAYPLDFCAEQIPSYENAVTLGESRDSDGQPRIRVAWRLTPQDIDSLVRTVRILRDSFGRSGCGELIVDDERLEEQISQSAPTGGHHIGTTRMADDPKQGVVDRNCTMHSISNLHIAGAGVFPTCGHANPTLTVVALSVRLAQHVKHLLRSY
jgi:choline dehydrogenase-like flavoprotein